MNPSDPVARAVATTTAAIDASVDAGEAPPALSKLAAQVHLSPSHLRRLFVDAVGFTPREYADTRRAAKLRDRLHGGADVSSAILESGYGSPSRVYERTGELLGMSPATARRGAPGELIRYTLADTSLGRIVVASTERGVCLVAFGDTDAELAEEVRRRFPRATVAPGGRAKALGSKPSSGSSMTRRVRPSCRSTCAARSSSAKSGRRCGRSRPERP